MKNSKARLHHHFILLALFIISSCYVVKEQKVVSTERIPASKKRVDTDYYGFTEKRKPSIENSHGVLEVHQLGNYMYETRERVERTKQIESGAIIMGGIATAGLSGWLFSNNTQWFSSETKAPEAFWTGALLGGLAWWLLNSGNKEKRTDYIYRPGIEFEFENEKLLTNTDILVSTNGLGKTIKSDSKGLLKYSPPLDFKLESSLDNYPVTFKFKKGDIDFIDSLQITPSDWMKRYAKIIAPKTVVKEPSTQNLIGRVREGTVYKVLKVDNNHVNVLMGAKVGRVKEENVSLFYATKAQNDYSVAIKSYVVEEMGKWLKQGEFELPEDYIKRISKKDEQLLIFTNKAMDAFQKEYISYFEWNNSNISRYDPNSQTYKIEIPELGEFVLKVPIKNAQLLKENWHMIQFKNQRFTLIDGNWKLVSFEIEDRKQQYVSRYDSKITSHYDPVNQFAFDFKDFEVEIPDLSVNTEEQPKVSETKDLDVYSIKTDLPETNMSNPDAIAVVIGNAFYQKTASVNYAINDAQLMKLYLTKVLGFKEGNIIFAMNTTKAELEGLFGTDKNYKGKLFNYIKPEISDVFVFYSGHGAPDPNTKEAYFIPTDCDPSYVNLQGYALKTFYRNLAKIPSKSTTVILDACFSGAGVLKNISSVRIKPKDSEENIKNSAILSSSSGTQVSSWHNQKRHGMFTYFFLKAIHEYKKTDKDKNNELTIREIYDYVADKTNGVPYYARRLNAVEQNPVLKGSNPERVLVKFN